MKTVIRNLPKKGKKKKTESNCSQHTKQTTKDLLLIFLSVVPNCKR